MNVTNVMNFIEQYGSVVICILVFVEYLNIPGYPGGITIPAVGVMMKMNLIGIPFGFILVLISSVIAYMFVYFICYLIKDRIHDFFTKTDRRKKSYGFTLGFIEKYGNIGLFIARLIPVARTLISIPSGLMGMKIRPYFLYSLLGTVVYTIVNLGIGYFLTGVLIK